MTEFQLRNFVVGSEATEFGRFQQCLVELRNRITSLERSYIKRERINLDLQEKSSLLEQKTEEIIRRRAELDLLDSQIDLRDLNRSIATLEGEAEDLKKILLGFSPEVIDTPEEQYWEQHLWRKVGLSIATNAPLSSNLIECILNMPEGSRVRQWLEKQVYEDRNNPESKDINDGESG